VKLYMLIPRGSVCFVLGIVVTCGKSFREIVYVDT
jgi:hypothetical protein